MNIYEKLMNVRVDLANLGIKKTGKNNFTKDSYYELEDFLPEAQRLMLHHGIAGYCDMNNCARLILVDFEKEESVIEFEIEFKKADIKGAIGIQNLGGTITYLRRYLWMLALEITEHDSVDSDRELDNKTKQESGQITKKHPVKKKRICDVCKITELNKEEARESLDKNDKIICSVCVEEAAKPTPEQQVEIILIPHSLAKYKNSCVKYLKRMEKDNGANKETYLEYAARTGAYEQVIKLYLISEMVIIDPEMASKITKDTLFKDCVVGFLTMC